MVQNRNLFTFLILALLITVYVVFYTNIFASYRSVSPVIIVQQSEIMMNECDHVDFDKFDNEKGTKTGCYLVPNYVHFIRFGLSNFSFVDTVCILAALKNQKPEKLFIHTDTTIFYGKYWKLLLETPGFKEILVIKYTEVPTEIFGKPLSVGWRKFHGGDVTRLKILMEYGGIFLDNDSYIVRSLDELRKYEMALGWMEGAGLANQVIIANRNARFLRKWLESYREYDSTKWYYNAGIKPTDEILKYHPEYVHREKILLANHHIIGKVFMEKWPEWRTHFAIHLLKRHQYLLKSISSNATYPVEFNEINVNNYPVTFRDMVYDVFPVNKTL